LQEARGGDIAVREGVVSQRPAVTVQPADVTADEGGNAQLSIIATVSSSQEQLACLIKHITPLSKPMSSALYYATCAIKLSLEQAHTSCKRRCIAVCMALVESTITCTMAAASLCFNCCCQGLGPLRYQWFKDSKRLTVATSDTPLLVLVDVGVSDSGTYYCQVSNKDGAVCSSKALLNIMRIGRVQHAAGALAAASEAGGSSGDQAASPLVSCACRK
jgi:hypothetical protein